MDDAGVDGAALDGAVNGDAHKEGGPPDRCASALYQPNPPDTCGDYIRYPCGLPAGLLVRGDCYFALNDCATLCPDVHFNCHAATNYCTEAGVDGSLEEGGAVVADEAGAVVIDCSTCLGSAGRAPEGLAPATAVRARSALGAYFASAARLEAASVIAFRRLREELSLHAAPAELLAAARDAERDEVRHTRAMARLARRHGGRYERPHVSKVGVRSLEEIARENAAEGCARETFGALVATWQAAHIDDPELARTLAAIAADETRHAALSWAITVWSLTKLDAGARARIESAWLTAVDALAAVEPPQSLASVALPSREQTQLLAAGLREMWSDLLAA